MGMSGTIKTTPTITMEGILSPLDIFIDETAISSAYEQHCTKQWVKTGDGVAYISLLKRTLERKHDLSMQTQTDKW